ncbi:uncharacterized protein LOC123398012 [Hordeum vulgare subsp. vulgare]|uniref:F-box domain-containing protein n=1 Tax=Hordeum vulgare subsp. vulgare TaxID=112509 RepID=A0A8I7BE64_HORVV|nr:uncharacterized protein LOC123398012 [Hordeum vulgare subsp. vulgare]
MGLLELNRLMSMRQRRRHRKIQSRSMSIASPAKRKGSLGQQDDNPQARKRRKYSLPDLPKDIWHDILSLLSLSDVARAGCVSHTFLSSWRSHPNLTLSKETLGLTGNACGQDELAQIFTNGVDCIMKKHSGGLKTFQLNYCGSFSDTSHLNRWLDIAVTPGIEEVKLSMPIGCNAVYYDFPCSVLFSGSGTHSIRRLHLSRCAFHPTAGLGCLTRLHLSQVHITGDELGHLLSNSLAMEELTLHGCDNIIRLKISCLVHRFKCLSVFDCTALQVIENKAPNVCLVRVDGALEERLVGDLSQVKELQMLDYYECGVVHYACSKLPFIMPNLETLGLSSAGEMLSTPILAVKFLYLKKLRIDLNDGQMGGFSPAYDYFSLAYFLDACPVVERFVLSVSQTRVKHELISDGDSNMRQMLGHRHCNLKNVRIMGFCSAKSMVELTCHILENATSLERLTLDAMYDNSSYGDADRSCVGKKGECNPKSRSIIMHARKGLWAIRKYVMEKVPSTVQLSVKKLCKRCHKIK